MQKAQGTLFLDKSGRPNRDRISAKITLAGIARDFNLDGEEWVHLRFGNHIVSNDRFQVISRDLHGKHLVLELQGANPDASIRIKLSYNSSKSLLDIDLDADRLDLTSLNSYLFLGADESFGSEADTVPFGFYLGGKYFAKANLNVHCAVNKQNITCNFHGKMKK